MADLKWVMQIVDKATAPAKNITKSLKGVLGSLKSLNLDKVTSIASRAMAKLGGAAKGAGKVFATQLAPMALAGLGAITAAAGAAAAAFAKFAVEDVIEGETLDWQLKQTIKDTKLLGNAISDVGSLANLLGGDDDLIEKQLKDLTEKSHDVGEAFKIIQAQADLKALGHDANGLVEAFKQVDDKGKLGAKSIAALGAAGVNTKKLREILGIAAGGDGEDDAEVIEKAIKGKVIDVAALQTAALKAISETTGKELGAVAKDFNDNTLGGILGKLKTAPGRLMNALDAGNALAPAKKLLNGLADALNPESETGKRFVALIQQISDTVGELLEKVSVDDVIKAVSGFASFLETTIELTGAIMGGLWEGLSFIMKPLRDLMVQLDDGSENTHFWADALKTLGQVIGFVLGAIILGFGAIAAVVVGAIELVRRFFAGVWFGIKLIPTRLGQMVDWFGEAFDSLFAYLGEVWEGFKSFGKAIVDGIWNGITGAWGTLKDGWNKLLATLPAAVKDKLEIHSPSRVMEEDGAHITGGVTKGVLKGKPKLLAAMTSVVTPPKFGLSSFMEARGAGLAGAGGGSIVIGDVYVDARGSAGDARGIGRTVRDEIVGLLIEARAEGGAP